MSASSSRTQSRSRPYAAAYAAAVAAGAAIGAAIAMPVPDVAASCPPPEEGLVLCTIQKAWLPAAAKVVFGAVAMAAVVRMLVVTPTSPRTKAPARAPGSTRAARALETTPPFDSDPYLLVATWGNTYEVERDGDGASRRRWRDRDGQRMRLREPHPG